MGESCCKETDTSESCCGPDKLCSMTCCPCHIDLDTIKPLVDKPKFICTACARVFAFSIRQKDGVLLPGWVQVGTTGGWPCSSSGQPIIIGRPMRFWRIRSPIIGCSKKFEAVRAKQCVT